MPTAERQITRGCRCLSDHERPRRQEFTRLARGARIVLSGGVSQYAAEQAHGPANYLELIGARASMTGFLTPDDSHPLRSGQGQARRVAARGPADLTRNIIEGGGRAFPDVLPKLFTSGTSASSYLPRREARHRTAG